MTTVVRARQKGVRGYVNTCRPTRWGNQWRIGQRFGERHNLTREEVLELYDEWLRISFSFNQEFRDAVQALKGRRLGCTCSQADIDARKCHACVLAAFVDEKFPDAPEAVTQ